jgi:ADP-ribose diphosphatase
MRALGRVQPAGRTSAVFRSVFPVTIPTREGRAICGGAGQSVTLALRFFPEDDLAKSGAKLLSSETLYRGKVFQLQRDTVIEPGGVQVERDIIVHPGSVVVMPVFFGGRVLLIRQYRHSVGDFLWELVAGRKEPGETPISAARRELVEETGYAAKRFRKLMRVVPTPGFVNEWMWIFAAEGLTAGAAQPEEDEKITPRIFTLKEAAKMIERGTLRDAKSICGILYYLHFVKRK